MNPPLRLYPAMVRFSPEGLGILESHHADTFSMKWRSDLFPKILRIVGGAGVLELEKKRFSFRANSICVIPPGVRHRLADEPGHAVSLCGIALRAPAFRFAGLLPQACGNARVIATPRVEFSALFKELFAEERLHAKGFEQMKTSIAWRIVVLLARTTPKEGDNQPDSRQRVEIAVADMRQEFWKDQSLDSAAQAAGLSRRRFTQLFREITSESWHERLERLRITHAGQLLKMTNIPIRAAAFECGYADIAHFYRTFRKHSGVSPAAFREKKTRPANRRDRLPGILP